MLQGLQLCLGLGQVVKDFGEAFVVGAAPDTPPRRGGRANRLEIVQGLGRLRGFAVQLRACNRPRLLLPVLLLSVAGWGLEALSLYWLIDQMGFGQVSPGYVTFSYATGLLAGVASILPGGLGGTELVMGSLLHLGGLTVAAASACTLILRVGTLGWACVLGWLCWPWAIRQVSGPKN